MLKIDFAHCVEAGRFHTVVEEVEELVELKLRNPGTVCVDIMIMGVSVTVT